MTQRAAASQKQNALRVLSIILVLVAGVSYLRDRLPKRVPIPLQPLTAAPDLQSAESLGVAPGSLRGFDVVLVTLDTTRPDRLGCYGNPSSPSPNLDRLARDGILFTGAVATGSTTLPTHTSILTGLYSQHHGVRANSHYRLDPEYRTLAEVLGDAGYTSAAFVSSFVLDQRFGLAQGFGTYDAPVVSSSGEVGFAERKGAQTTDRAIRWLRSHTEQPIFLWVHYYDPHAPHDPPSPFRESQKLPYDGEIASADHEVGRLLEAIGPKRREHTLWIVVGDHGEAFGEHGEWSHGYLLQEATLRIPLIVDAGRGLPRGVRIDARVSQVDLMPTILSLLGIDPPSSLDGVPLTQRPAPGRPVLAENVEGWAQFGWARLAAVYQRTLKYVEGPTPELYDFGVEPLDTDNVISDHAADASMLRNELREQEGPDARRLLPSSVDLGAADWMRLQALGYVSGDGVARSDDSSGADPNTMMPTMIEMQELINDYQQQPGLSDWTRLSYLVSGKTLIDSRAELIDQLERLAAEHPDFAPVYPYLATYYDEEKRPADAESARQKFESITGRN